METSNVTIFPTLQIPGRLVSENTIVVMNKVDIVTRTMWLAWNVLIVFPSWVFACY
jgi:hypothetical protein